jgi:hypothetical protein
VLARRKPHTVAVVELQLLVQHNKPPTPQTVPAAAPADAVPDDVAAAARPDNTVADLVARPP